MKQYKLIKDYPGCIFKIGDFLKIDLKKTRIHPEKYPEFWEEVIEKDYEILSLQCIVNPNKGLIYTVKNGELINSNGDLCNFSIENAVTFWVHQYKSWQIYSVKRLSDGEIFTIGDNVKMFKENSKIKSFRILSNSEFVTDFINSCSTTNIESFNKIKTSLFTTEDGVDIFKNDFYYFIDFTWIIRKTHCIIDVNEYYKNHKTFSTKEKAEECRFYNKPCLSLNDVQNIFTSKTSTRNKKLQELVKSKIK